MVRTAYGQTFAYRLHQSTTMLPWDLARSWRLGHGVLFLGPWSWRRGRVGVPNLGPTLSTSSHTRFGTTAL